ncbi:class I SAM-dependent methyltransferase [Candidatus Woesearchaeota archaeon]|nr:class I SAM-dependent methyltransferase [Candidatus Woesearchaeota archaeon]
MVKNFNNIYNERGAYHFNLQGFHKYWYHENYSLIKKFIGNFSDKTILDVCCGDGFLTSQLGENAIGVDNSKEGIKLAKKLTKNKYYIADMRYLPFKDGSFDVVVNSVSMIYVDINELPNLIREFRRVLKPNGKMVISYPNIKDFKRRIYVFFGKEKDYRRESIEMAPGEISLDKFEKLFIDEGLKIKDKAGIFITFPYLGDRFGKYEFFYNFMTKLAKFFPYLSHTLVYEFTLN